MNERNAAFILQDANIMGTRIQWYLEQHQALETLGIVATGAIWSFVASLDYTEAVEYLVWLPAAICLLLGGKSYIFTKTLNEAFDYLYALEDLHLLPPEAGWVHFFRARSGKFKRRWRTVFWVLIIVVNAAAAQFLNFSSLLPQLKGP